MLHEASEQSSNSYDADARLTWSSMLSDSFLSQVHPHERGSVTRVASLGSASSLVHHHLQLLVALGQQRLHQARKSVINAASQVILNQFNSCFETSVPQLCCPLKCMATGLQCIQRTAAFVAISINRGWTLYLHCYIKQLKHKSKATTLYFCQGCPMHRNGKCT